MSPTKPNKPESPKNPDTTNPAPATPPASPRAEVSTKPTDATPAKADGKAAKSKNTGRDGTRIISVSIPEKLARQVKLLCSVTGQTAQALVESALQKAVNKQLASALDSIRPDVES